MTGKEIYYRRKEAGLCTRCGGELEESRKGRVMCGKCAEKANNDKKLDTISYIRVGICPCCRKHRLVGDEHLCFECHEKKIARSKKYRDKCRENDLNEYKTKCLESSKKSQKKKMEQGVCVRCGRKKSTYTLLCEKCKRQDKEKWQEKRGIVCDKSLRAELGMCVNCGQPAYPGYKLCKSCYEKSCKNLQKAWDKYQKDKELLE